MRKMQLPRSLMLLALLIEIPMLLLAFYLAVAWGVRACALRLRKCFGHAHARAASRKRLGENQNEEEGEEWEQEESHAEDVYAPKVDEAWKSEDFLKKEWEER